MSAAAILGRNLVAMMVKATRRLAWLLLALSMGAACWTCADIPARVRKYTYPPDFNYITTKQLHSTMWQLAEQTERLNQILRLMSPVTETERAEIVQLLNAMQTVTDDLTGQGWSSNHPEVDFNLGRFQRDVALARRSVESDPPNYFLAGSLSGACLYCHDRSR